MRLLSFLVVQKAWLARLSKLLYQHTQIHETPTTVTTLATGTPVFGHLTSVKATLGALSFLSWLAVLLSSQTGIRTV